MDQQERFTGPDTAVVEARLGFGSCGRQSAY